MICRQIISKLNLFADCDLLKLTRTDLTWVITCGRLIKLFEFLNLIIFHTHTSFFQWEHLKFKRLNTWIALNGTPMTELWDVPCHIGSYSLPATWHKWTHPALTPAHSRVLNLPILEGWKADWLTPPSNGTDGNRTGDLLITSPMP